MPQQLAALPDRHRLEVELAHLRRRRGASLLDGQPFDGEARLRELEGELIALGDADAVAVERERGAANDGEAGRLAKLREVIELANNTRLAALASAGQALDYAVGEIARAIELTDKIRVAGAAIPMPAELALDTREIRRRIANWIAGALRPIADTGYAMGEIEWGNFAKAEPDWSTAERAVSSHVIAMLLAGPVVAGPVVAEAPISPSSRSFNELSDPAEPDGEPEDADLETVTASS